MNKLSRTAAVAHVLTILALNLGACVLDSHAPEAQDGDSALGSHEQALYYWDLFKVQQRDVPVCWMAVDGDADVDAANVDRWKKKVKEALLGQRSWRQVANINFVGWKACAEEDPLGIRITPSKFGGSSWGAKTDMRLPFSSKWQAFEQVCMARGLSGDECVQAVALHEFGHALGYLHEQGRLENQDASLCDEGGQDHLPEATGWGPFDHDSIMNYCADNDDLSVLDRRGTERLYGPRFADSPRLADYDGDLRDDLFCFEVLAGSESIDYSEARGEYGGASDWSKSAGWCNGTLNRRLFNGYFNADSRADLLCFDEASGQMWFDYASAAGRFPGTRWSTATGWCGSPGESRLYVADFNGDRQDDLLCQRTARGNFAIDFSDGEGKFQGSDVLQNLPICRSATGRLFVRDFSGDGRADLLCFDVESGIVTIDYASTSGTFQKVEWTATEAWCNGSASSEILTGDFDGDLREDLLCHDAATGAVSVDLADKDGRFGGTDFVASQAWCAGGTSRLFVGDTNGDGRDDLVCQDVRTGIQAVDHANGSGRFQGVDHQTSTPFCAQASGELH